ncbi:MAG: methyltransferase domain-containing protein, partial [Chitinophagales bacterium]
MKNTLLNKFLQKTIPPRVDLKFRRLKPFIKGPKVLDIGCGNGGFSLKLMQEGFDVTPLDIQDKSAFEQIKPLVFDGKNLPFEDNTFDTALLITVLHHTTAQKELISEALRAARQVLIMEDVYGNALQKQATFWMDSLVNWEWQ